MNCPNCNSDQVNALEIRSGFHYVECVNCDHEGYADTSADNLSDSIEASTAYAEAIVRERGIRRGRK